MHRLSLWILLPVFACLLLLEYTYTGDLGFAYRLLL